MTVSRIPLSIATEINRLRLLGRTDRQIEVFCSLPAHSLDRPYLIDDSEERETARVRRDRAESFARIDANIARVRSRKTAAPVPGDIPLCPEGQAANDATPAQCRKRQGQGQGQGQN